MKWTYVLEPDGDKVLEISIGAFKRQQNTEVRLNGKLIYTFPDQRVLEEGQVLQLPDGTALTVERFKNKVWVLQNDTPLPAISSDPESVIYFLAGLNIVLGLITLNFQVEFLQTPGSGILLIAIGILFVVVGFFTQRRSLIALILAMILFGLEGALVLLSGFQMLLTAFSAGTSLHRIGEILQNEALLIGGLVGGTGLYISWLILMVKGVIEISAVKKKLPSKLPVINLILSRGLAFVILVGFIILSAGIYYIYAPKIYQTVLTVINEPSIDERNAAASEAVAYESGAGFVKALERAGFPCTNPTISPFTASAAGLTFHVADNVSCDYRNDDVVRAFVAWPSEFGREYFSEYFEHYMEAKAETGAQSLTLEGELWFAWGSDDRGLFDIQEALGGQLVKP